MGWNTCGKRDGKKSGGKDPFQALASVQGLKAEQPNLGFQIRHVKAENFCFAASSSGSSFSMRVGMSIRLVATDKLMAATV